MSSFLSFLYAVYFFLVSIVTFAICIPVAALTYLFDKQHRVVEHIVRFMTHYALLVSPGWTCKFTGREHLELDGPAVLIANHQSFADIVLLSGLPKSFKWVAKSSLFKVPFLGWVMHMAAYVPISRGDMKSTRSLLLRCQQLIEDGNSVMMFPEGTRSEDGSMLPFRDGPFYLSKQCNVPVIPVVVHGTASLLPKNARFMNFIGAMSAQVLPAINPTEFESISQLKNHVQNTMAIALTEMQQVAKSDDNRILAG